MRRHVDVIAEDNARERDIALRPARPSGGPFDLRPRCSGGMTAEHTGRDVLPVRLGYWPNVRTVHLCRDCREAAGRLGLIE